jgi:ferric-dicitrate binding protein FerR (iron transport regulator)
MAIWAGTILIGVALALVAAMVHVARWVQRDSGDSPADVGDAPGEQR